MRHKTVPVLGVRLHWAELGETNGKPPVVFLHGLCDSHLTWTPTANALANDRRVLLPDLPGHGLSERPDAGYELAWHSRVIAAWLLTLGLAQVDVVGHSFGGGVAQMLLLDCPERLRRLVLVAPGGLGRHVRMTLRLASLPFMVEKFGQPFMALGTRLVLSGAAYTRAEIAQLSRMNAQRGTARAFARTVRDTIGPRGQKRGFFKRAHELGELPPMVLHWGDRDRVIPMSHAHSFIKAVEGVELRTFENCGHYPHREKPELFLSHLLQFLDEPAPPRARLRTGALRRIAQDLRRRLLPADALSLAMDAAEEIEPKRGVHRR